jgi:hypothetical protein
MKVHTALFNREIGTPFTWDIELITFKLKNLVPECLHGGLVVLGYTLSGSHLVTFHIYRGFFYYRMGSPPLTLDLHLPLTSDFDQFLVLDDVTCNNSLVALVLDSQCTLIYVDFSQNTCYSLVTNFIIDEDQDLVPSNITFNPNRFVFDLPYKIIIVEKSVKDELDDFSLCMSENSPKTKASNTCETKTFCDFTAHLVDIDLDNLIPQIAHQKGMRIHDYSCEFLAHPDTDTFRYRWYKLTLEERNNSKSVFMVLDLIERYIFVTESVISGGFKGFVPSTVPITSNILTDATCSWENLNHPCLPIKIVL